MSPHLATSVPLILFPPEPQVIILNGSLLTPVQRLIWWQLLNQISVALRTFNTHLTYFSLYSYSSNSYFVWMKLQALWAQAHFTVVFLTDDIRQGPRQPDSRSADKGSGWITELLWCSAPNKAWRAFEWRFRYISFPGLRNTHAHSGSLSHVCSYRQDRWKKQDKGKDIQVNVKSSRSSPLTRVLINWMFSIINCISFFF